MNAKIKKFLALFLNKIYLKKGKVISTLKGIFKFILSLDIKILILIPIIIIIAIVLINYSAEYIWDDFADMDDIIPRKSLYASKDKYLVHFSDLEVPTYPDGINGAEVMYVDMVFETSTRYLKYYIDKNSVPLIDIINSSLSKVSFSFLLTPEGKDLLLDKIMREINDYLIRVGPKGQLVKGYIVSILGASGPK